MKKEAILKAAIHLFAEKGFVETSTGEIAARAGVAQGTIFYHFKTKENILLEVFENLMDNYLAELKQEIEAASSGLLAIEKAIRFHLHFSRAKTRELLVILRDMPSHFIQSRSQARKNIRQKANRLVEVLASQVERGRKDGSIRASVAPLETSFILRSLLFGLTRHKLPDSLDSTGLSEHVVDFCLTSLANNANGVE